MIVGIPMTDLVIPADFQEYLQGVFTRVETLVPVGMLVTLTGNGENRC
jgi:hypothetical protein